MIHGLFNTIASQSQLLTWTPLHKLPSTIKLPFFGQ